MRKDRSRWLAAATVSLLLFGLVFAVARPAAAATIRRLGPSGADVWGCSASAVSYQVDGVADDVQIQQALDDAASGDIIEFCPRTYEYADDVTRFGSSADFALTIRGWNGHWATLDGNDDHLLFSLVANFPNSWDVTLSEMTFTHGSANFGTPAINGGALWVSGSLIASSVAFVDNWAQGNGGAVYADGVASFTSCTFEGNAAAWGGGGALAGYDVSVDDCSFTDNSLGQGSIGGGAISAQNLSVTSSSFEDNGSASFGGAIYTDGGVSVSTSSFSGNHADLEGGAIFSAGMEGEAVISSSTFDGNDAGGWGGALSLGYPGGYASTATISLSTFTANRAQRGGAIDAWCERLILDRNRFVANVANVFGGAVTRWGPMQRTDVSGNSFGSRSTSNVAPLGPNVAVYWIDWYQPFKLREARLAARAFTSARISGVAVVTDTSLAHALLVH